MEMKEAYNCIYKITNVVNNKIYIGKAKDLKKRINQHIKAAQAWKYQDENNLGHKHKSRLYPAMNLYGYDNFIVDVIESNISENILNEREKYWISYFNTIDDKIGYNIASGGNGGNLFKNLTEDEYKLTCEHYKKAAIKREANQDKRKKISQTMKQVRQQKPIWNKGISPKKESVEKWKTTMHLKRESGWQPAKYIVKSKKAVFCIELNLEFAGAKEACEFLNIEPNISNKKRIQKFCRGKLKKPVFGYTWRWA